MTERDGARDPDEINRRLAAVAAEADALRQRLAELAVAVEALRLWLDEQTGSETLNRKGQQ